MKIEEGMYVRYKRIGDGEKIAKIKEILPPNDRYDTTFYKFNDFDGTIEEFIVKASYNIIDLIEEGDYVNGHRVDIYRGKLGIFLIYENCWKFEKIENITKDCGSFDIVTKEQFKSMEYEIGE